MIEPGFRSQILMKFSTKLCERLTIGYVWRVPPQFFCIRKRVTIRVLVGLAAFLFCIGAVDCPGTIIGSDGYRAIGTIVKSPDHSAS